MIGSKRCWLPQERENRENSVSQKEGKKIVVSVFSRTKTLEDGVERVPGAGEVSPLLFVGQSDW